MQDLAEFEILLPSSHHFPWTCLVCHISTVSSPVPLQRTVFLTLTGTHSPPIQCLLSMSRKFADVTNVSFHPSSTLFFLIQASDWALSPIALTLHHISLHPALYTTLDLRYSPLTLLRRDYNTWPSEGPREFSLALPLFGPPTLPLTTCRTVATYPSPRITELIFKALCRPEGRDVTISSYSLATAGCMFVISLIVRMGGYVQ